MRDFRARRVRGSERLEASKSLEGFAMPFIRLLLAALLGLCASPSLARPDAILIFSHTTGYRHDSIPAGIRAITAIAKRRGLAVVASEDPAMFDPGRLVRFRAIVLLSTTTDPKRPESEY
jgi:hypothetical protein